MKTMKPLHETFQGRADQRGFQFQMLKREGDVCLFEKRNATGPVRYEVAILHQRPKREFPGGRLAEAHEAMPSPEEWGLRGWSPATLEAARARFDTVLKQSHEPQL
jgi:hypothetical protein